MKILNNTLTVAFSRCALKYFSENEFLKFIFHPLDPSLHFELPIFKLKSVPKYKVKL